MGSKSNLNTLLEGKVNLWKNMLIPSIKEEEIHRAVSTQ